MQTQPLSWRRIVATGACLLGGLVAVARGQQAKYPPLPDKFDVRIHYKIDLPRDDRVSAHEAMLGFFKKNEFMPLEREDSDLDGLDGSIDILTGVSPSANTVELLRHPHVQSLLISPQGYKLEEGKKLKVILHIQPGLEPFQQQKLFEQTRAIVEPLGFVEDMAYDTRGFTRLRGVVDAGVVPILVRDVRQQAKGWFVPEKLNKELQYPIRGMLPIRIVQVLHESAVSPLPAPTLPPVPAGIFEKLSGELRKALTVEKPLRVEVLLERDPTDRDSDWRRLMQRAPQGMFIEGRMGNIVTVKIERPSLLQDLAALPYVTGVRLPPTAPLAVAGAGEIPPPKEKIGFRPDPQIRRAAMQEGLDIFQATRLNWLHGNGKRGENVRIALIAEDFSGLGQFLGNKLPADTQLIDMTALRNLGVLPDPGGAGIGSGTERALAAMLAAPAAKLTLIRIDRASPYMVMDAARLIHGDAFTPESQRSLRDRLDVENQVLEQDTEAALAQYRKIFDNFSDEDHATRLRGEKAKAEREMKDLSYFEQFKDLSDEQIGKKLREQANEGLAKVKVRSTDLTERLLRLDRISRALQGLRGTQVVICTETWDGGYAYDGLNPLSRYLDESFTTSLPPAIKNASRQPRPAVWFQAAGDTRGQSWMGTVSDVDNNGVFEFAPQTTPVPKDRWSRELNFLAFRPFNQAPTADLPANAVLRVTMQWREPHDETFPLSDFRVPIVDAKLQLFKQLDPNAEKIPSDELQMLARSEAPAELLRAGPRFGVYQQSFIVTLPDAGRYALRMLGSVPTSTKPAGFPSLDAGDTQWSLSPKIFVETLDAASRSAGQVVFADFVSFFDGVTMPADSRGAIAVGAAAVSKRPHYTSSVGAGTGVELWVKPDVLMFDSIPGLPNAQGTPIAASFAGGMAASMLSAGAQQSWFLQTLRIPPGHFFEVPEFWFKK